MIEHDVTDIINDDWKVRDTDNKILYLLHAHINGQKYINIIHETVDRTNHYLLCHIIIHLVKIYDSKDSKCLDYEKIIPKH